MGMYTQLVFNARLKPDTPDEVLETLKYMLGQSDEPLTSYPDHELFSTTERWSYMLTSSSYYHYPTFSNSRLIHDDVSSYGLAILCDLKNYSDEIGKFIDWIMPYVETHGREFLGYWRYEEDDDPTLIYSHG